MNLEEKGFIHKYHLICGVIGCSITVLNMLFLTLMKNGILRVEYHLFYSVILPNTVAKLFLCVWVLHYCITKKYKRDVNILARDILGLVIANVLVIAFDESTILYYLSQTIPCAMILVFMLIIITRLRDAITTKKDTDRVLILNILLYVMIVLQVFIMAISFSNYDPYLVSFVGISYLAAVIGMIEINRVEKIAQMAVAEDSDSIDPETDDDSSSDDDEEDEFDEEDDY